VFAGAWRPITGDEPGNRRPAGTASEVVVVCVLKAVMNLPVRVRPA